MKPLVSCLSHLSLRWLKILITILYPCDLSSSRDPMAPPPQMEETNAPTPVPQSPAQVAGAEHVGLKSTNTKVFITFLYRILLKESDYTSSSFEKLPWLSNP
mmetsp:Transcript_30288/g.64165  ORF Transcript_30288/g.64165 Transcript_30288/m.64165 type:complete len:102 (+) Transcript_30288:1861-2166(+)